MSKNLKQVYDLNPALSIQGTDIFYLIRSPYGTTDDFGAEWAFILASIQDQLQALLTTFTVTGTSQAITPNTSYIANNAGLITFTLPTVADTHVGDIIEIIGFGAGGWTVTYGTGQQIHFLGQSSTVTTGSLSSINQYDCCTMKAVTTSEWVVNSAVGNLSVI